MTRNNSSSIATLRERLNSVRTERRDIQVGSHTEEREICVRPCGGEDRSWIDTESYDVKDYETQSFIVPNKEERLRALEICVGLFNGDSGDAKTLLVETYKHNASREIRARAGKVLGYSQLRIWAHEHPVIATAAGILVTGSVSGLVYTLSEYFSK